MEDLAKKAARRLTSTARTFRADLAFSPGLAVCRVLDDLSWRLGMKRLSAPLHQRKDDYVLRFLGRTLDQTLQTYKTQSSCGTYQKNAPIWVCWWDGENAAPALVRQCIKSIRHHAGNHPVIFIWKENCAEYLSLPTHILQHVNCGTMGLAHLSDYIRVSLLHQYGGLWLDATVFCSQPIPEDCFCHSFFTCKSARTPCRSPSKLQWTTFVLGGWKGSSVYGFLKEALETYWEKHPTAIDYLFFDSILALGQESLPFLADEIDRVPLNNLHRDALQAAMHAAAPAEVFDRVVCNGTTLYKLSWRERYREKTPDGRETVYTRFLQLPL